MKQSILYFLGRHKGKFIILFSLSSIYLSIIFYFGYRIPGKDRHPDWLLFPINNVAVSKVKYYCNDIIIEDIDFHFSIDSIYKVINFDKSKFNLPDSLQEFRKYKPAFLKIDSTVLISNKFELGSNFSYSLNTTGGGGGISLSYKI